MSAGDVFSYVGVAYTVVSGLHVMAEGAVALCAVNGKDGPEDRVAGRVESFLRNLSDILSRFGADVRVRK